VKVRGNKKCPESCFRRLAVETNKRPNEEPKAALRGDVLDGIRTAQTLIVEHSFEFSDVGLRQRLVPSMAS